MKKRVKNVLKIIGSGLEAAHAGEMLTRNQKAKVLACRKVIAPDVKKGIAKSG